MNQESIINPPSNINLPPCIIFAPTTFAADAVLKSSCFSAPETRHDTFSGGFPFHRTPTIALVGPAIGSPAAVLAVEPLLASGAKTLFLLGTCGGLIVPNNTPAIGDIIFPRGGLSEEGTSKHYGGSERINFESSALQQKLEQQISANLSDTSKAIEGLVWTTDVPYKETHQKLETYGALGAVAVDMEFTALAQLVRHYDCQFACALVISDLVGPTWQAGFSNAAVKKNLRFLCDTILRIAF